jgi:hypothetical protein
MYQIGSRITDPEGFLWIVTSIWEYEDRKDYKLYLCLAMIGAEHTKSAGQMAGKRFEIESMAVA